MRGKTAIKSLVMITIFLFSILGVTAATLTCEQISDASLDISQFSSKIVEIKCSATGGTVSNIQITPNADPSTGLTISSTQTISSSISDQSSSTAKWSMTGDSPNTYTVSYTVSSDGSNGWDGASTTEVDVTSPAKLTVEYVSAPSEYSDGETLDVKVNNIGGTTANNVKLKLNSGSLKSYPTSISAGASASYSWTSSTGYDGADTYLTKVYIGDVLQDSVSAVVSEEDNESEEEEEDNNAGGSSSGGAGGAGGSIEIKNFGNLTGTGVMEIDNSNYALTEISVDVKSLVTNAKLYVEKVYEPDEDTYPEVDGTVYQYQMISGNEIEDNLDKAEVKFKVSKSWLESKEFDKERIFLLRFNGVNWVQESVAYTTQDSDNVYYKAEIANLGMIAVAYLPEVELEYVKMSDLEPELIDLQMVIESGLGDALMIDRIETYLFGKLNVEKTIELSKEFVEGLDIKREVNVQGNKSMMTVTVKNTKDESISFLLVEAVPKSIVHDIYELYDFSPRKYDLIIREDPVIQWSFGKADTAIVAWDIKELKPGDTAEFSYYLDAVFEIKAYPAPILVTPFLEKATVAAVEDGEKEIGLDDVSSNKIKNVSIILTLLLLLSVVGFVAYTYYMPKGPKLEDAGKSTVSKHADHHDHKVTKISEYIKKQTAKGKKIDDVKKSLKKVGWDKETIDKAVKKHHGK